MNDQPVVQATTYIAHNKHACPQWTRTHDPINQAATDLHLRPHGHQDWHSTA